MNRHHGTAVRLWAALALAALIAAAPGAQAQEEPPGAEPTPEAEPAPQTTEAPPPPPPTPAGQARLDAARAQVAELERKITAGQNEVTALKNRLNALSAQVGREATQLGTIRTQIGETNAKLDETKTRMQQLRDRMSERARTVYMKGPMQLVELVLGSKSLTDFTERIAYASALARQDAKLEQLARKTQAELDEQRERQQSLESDQRSQLAAVSSQQRAVRSTFNRQVALATDLARQRREAHALVSQLEKELSAGELAGLRRVAGQGMTISYGQWASEFLSALGAPASRNNMVVVVAWEAAEGTQATWNPLATTKDWPGATTFNSHGVKNYPTKGDGIQATIATLRLPNRGYEPIIARLKASAEPMHTAEAIRDSRWCAGCAGGQYVVGIVAAVEENYERYAN